VLGIDCSPISPKSREYDFGPSISAWEAIRYRLIPSYRAKSPPDILGIFSQIMDTNGLYRLRFTGDAADLIIRLPTREFGMFGFEYGPQIIEAGYRATTEQLAAWLPHYRKS
jgi:predicted acylesterase/phospholipase RssA